MTVLVTLMMLSKNVKNHIAGVFHPGTYSHIMYFSNIEVFNSA